MRLFTREELRILIDHEIKIMANGIQGLGNINIDAIKSICERILKHVYEYNLLSEDI